MDTAYRLATRPASAAARGCIYGMFVSAMGCGIPDREALDRAVVSAALAAVQRWSLYQVRVAERSVPSSRWFMTFDPGPPTVEVLHAFLAFHGAAVVDSALAVSLARRNLRWVDLSRSVRLTRPVTWLDSAAVERRLDAGILRRLFDGGCLVGHRPSRLAASPYRG